MEDAIIREMDVLENFMLSYFCCVGEIVDRCCGYFCFDFFFYDRSYSRLILPGQVDFLALWVVKLITHGVNEKQPKFKNSRVRRIKIYFENDENSNAFTNKEHF